MAYRAKIFQDQMSGRIERRNTLMKTPINRAISVQNSEERNSSQGNDYKEIHHFNVNAMAPKDLFLAGQQTELMTKMTSKTDGQERVLNS